MNRLLILVAGLSALVGGCNEQHSDPTPTSAADTRKDNERFQGVWKIDSVDTGDVDINPTNDEMERLRFVFHGDRAFVYDAKEKKNEDGDATFSINPAANPKTIDLKEAPPFEDDVRVGIYRFDGEKLVIAMTMGDEPKRPTEFKSVPSPNPGSKGGIWVYTLKKTTEPVPKVKDKK